MYDNGDSLIAEFKSIGDELHKEITALLRHRKGRH